MSIITSNPHKMQTDEMLEILIHTNIKLKCDLSPAHGHSVIF